jgi:hypothetical protein
MQIARAMDRYWHGEDFIDPSQVGSSRVPPPLAGFALQLLPATMRCPVGRCTPLMRVRWQFHGGR